jgi:PKD repeat protein
MLYDSFDQINPYLWGRNGNVSVSESTITLQGTGSNPYSQNYIRSIQSFSPGVRLVMRAKIGDPSGSYSGSEYSLIGFKGETTWDRLGITSLHRTAVWNDGRTLPIFDEEYHIISLYWTGYFDISMEIDSELPFPEVRSPGSATMNVMLNVHQSFETIDVDWLFVANCNNAYSVAIDPEEVLFLLQTPSFYWLGLQKAGEPIQFKLLNQNSFVSWDFGDGYISYASEPAHIYTSPGTYTVTLKAGDIDGNPQLTVADEIIISDTEHYVIDFDASVRYGQFPLTVQFYNLSPDADSWLWDFGDGTTSTDQHPEHTYQDPQTFTVKLVSTNGSLVRSHIRENFIRVTENDIPKAGFTISPDTDYGTSPHRVTFIDTSTGTITNAYWDMDGERIYETNPAYTFTRPGTAIIKRVVSNPDWTDELMTSIYIVPSGVIRIFATPLRGISGDEVQFKSFIAAPYTKVSWDFGDGNTSEDLSPVHTFTTPGTYTVTLSVWTGPVLYPVTKPLSYVVIDADDLPVPEFSASALTGNAPLEVTFTDLSTGEVDTYLWDFGDGTTSTESDPVHEYTTDGRFTVSLTVENEYGSRTMTKYHFIRVFDVPEAAFSATYTGPSVTTPRPADMLPPYNGWTVAFHDLSTNSPSSWLWDFGDGTTSTDQNPTHVFTTIGKSYWIELTVTNTAGTDIVGMDITVLPTYFNIPVIIYNIHTTTSPYMVSFMPGSWESNDTFIWDFGDGTKSTERMPVKEYTFPGMYVVSFSQISSHGAITKKTVIEVK